MAKRKNKSWKWEDKSREGSHEWKWDELKWGNSSVCIHCGVTFDYRHKPCLPEREEANFRWVDGKKVYLGKKRET